MKAERNVSDHILLNLLARSFTHRSAFPRPSAVCPLELLAQLKLTHVTERIRLATEKLYQELIDAVPLASAGFMAVSATDTATSAAIASAVIIFLREDPSVAENDMSSSFYRR